MWATEARARLQTALQGLWGGKIIHRAIIWWVTIISSLLSSTFSRLCCSWLPALHLLPAESSWDTKRNPHGRSHGVGRACDGSLLFPFATHQQLALAETGYQGGTTPATHPLSRAWWGHCAPVIMALCHLAANAWSQDLLLACTGLFDQTLVRLPLRKQMSRVPQMLVLLEDGKLTYGWSFSCDIPCRMFRWQSLLLVCKCEGEFLVLVYHKSFWFTSLKISR